MKKKKFLTVIAALLLSLSVVGAASASTPSTPHLEDGSKRGTTACAKLPVPCMP